MRIEVIWKSEVKRKGMDDKKIILSPYTYTEYWTESSFLIPSSQKDIVEAEKVQRWTVSLTRNLKRLLNMERLNELCSWVWERDYWDVRRDS